MCGIVGIGSPSEPVDDALLARMRDSMVHRGPDGAGSWISMDRAVGLAHRRLAIIDLSSGAAQPMANVSGDLNVTFNGEIYNFRALRRDLQARGHAFRTSSDTEIILVAYREWGVKCLERLDGMFAFALYDSRSRRLFLARDRAGEKPLYYHKTHNRFVFASELKAIMADPSFTRRLSLEALELYLTFGYVPGNRCMLSGVHKLPPGHAMTYDRSDGTLKIWQYWALPEPYSGNLRESDAELTDELDHLLEDSLRSRMVADVPVGILLSGGIDSSLLTAMAARVSAKPVKTFTVCFPGEVKYDEGGFARTIASHFGTTHVELPAEDMTSDLLPNLARQFDEPLADSSLLPTYLVSRLVREHATVALGGDGGDELFGGYIHYNSLLTQDAQRRYLPTFLWPVIGATAARLLPFGLRGRNYLMQLAAGASGGIARTNTYFDPVLRHRILNPEVNSILRERPRAEDYKSALFLRHHTLLQNCTAIDFQTYLAEDILTKVDRASMLTSLEVRAPMLDHRIIEFAFSRVPDHLRTTKSGRKILPKMLAQRLLPADTDLVRKQGFSVPLAKWLQLPSWQPILDIVRASDHEIFRKDEIERLANGQRKHSSNSHQIFALAIFSLWQAEYRVSC